MENFVKTFGKNKPVKAHSPNVFRHYCLQISHGERNIVSFDRLHTQNSLGAHAPLSGPGAQRTPTAEAIKPLVACWANSVLGNPLAGTY